MALTRESVEWGYRFVLGRMPESEQAIADHMQCEDIEALRRVLLASEEFAGSVGLLVDPKYMEAARKLAQTGNKGRTGFKKADYAYVGLEEPAQGEDFPAQFARLFEPRLGADRDRGPGFRAIVEALDRLGPAGPLIVETGCMRIPGNWQGDGQSTFIFDAYVRHRGGAFFSIDFNIESIDTARRACSGRTNLVHNDSVIALATLAGLMEGRRVDLLYLDSFDLEEGNAMPSATHHIMELAAIRPLLRPGSIVCVDDYRAHGAPGGKGLIVDSYMNSVDAAVLYDGYQKAWQLR